MEVLLLLIGGDETTRHTLSGGTEQLLRAPRSAPAPGGRSRSLLPNAIEEMLRWTAPVKNMAARSPPTPSSTAPSCTRARRSSCCSSRRTSTRRCSRMPENFRHRALPEQPPGVRLRHALLPGQPARPAGAVDHADRGCCSGCRTCGWRRTPTLAAAAGQLRVRPGDDAGGLHPERAAGYADGPSVRLAARWWPNMRPAAHSTASGS